MQRHFRSVRWLPHWLAVICIAAIGATLALFMAATPASAGPGGDRLNAGESLAPGQNLASADGRFHLIMQTDGNVVLRNPANVPLWSSDTPGYPGADLEMQTDGNLVVYRSGHAALKATGKFDSNPQHVRQLVLQSDGNLVVYFNGVAQWASNTADGTTAPRPTGIRLCVQVGFYAGFRIDSPRGNTLQTAVAIAMAESSCSPNATHQNTNHTTDTGLWQINSVHTQWTHNELLDPQTNANAAWSISGGGASWSPWSTFNNRRYGAFLGPAQAAINQL
jgi:hypothetical protein